MRAFRYAGGEEDREGDGFIGGFTEGEQGDGEGAEVPKRGEVMATGGAPILHVGVSRLFLFTAVMWKVSRIAMIVTRLDNTHRWVVAAWGHQGGTLEGLAKVRWYG